MKLNINKIAILGLSCLIFLAASPMLQGCKDSDEAEKWVDLRYGLDEAPYEFEATNAAPKTIRVKSTDPWEVFGTKDWCVITPDKGEAGETYTVTITCKDNPELDDRTDIITIKSDYWTGKQFTIFQKGTAYLDIAEGENEISMTKEGEEKEFHILTNQKWTAEVTEGDKWLSITSATSGENDGIIKIKTIVNRGEKRIGEIALYDRHGVAGPVVKCTQDGITLSPDIPENNKWFALQPESQELVVNIESDVEWTASKENPEDEWFDFTKADGKITIQIKEHTGQAVRTGVIVIASNAGEGTEPVTKYIKFKQINPLYAIPTTIGRPITAAEKYTKSGMSYGKYMFHMTPPYAGTIAFVISWTTDAGGMCNVQYQLQSGQAKGGTSPWNNLINYSGAGGAQNYYKKVDQSKNNSIGIEIKEGTKFDSATGKKLPNFIWYVNDEVVADFEAIKAEFNPATMFWEKVNTPTGVLNITYNGGDGITVDKYDYYPPLDWGE